MLQDGFTALHNAALSGEVEVINLLVKHGAAVDIRNEVVSYLYGVWGDLHCDTDHVKVNWCIHAWSVLKLACM